MTKTYTSKPKKSEVLWRIMHLETWHIKEPDPSIRKTLWTELLYLREILKTKYRSVSI